MSMELRNKTSMQGWNPARWQSEQSHQALQEKVVIVEGMPVDGAWHMVIRGKTPILFAASLMRDVIPP